MRHGRIGYRHGCRCDLCRQGHTAEQNRQNARRRASRVLVDGRLLAPLPPDRHGRWSTYANHGCQCDPCRAVGSAVNARNSERRRRAS